MTFTPGELQHVCSIKGNDAVHLQLLVWCWRGFAVAARRHGNRSTEETVIFQQAGCHGKPTMVLMGGGREETNSSVRETRVLWVNISDSTERWVYSVNVRKLDSAKRRKKNTNETLETLTLKLLLIKHFYDLSANLN